MAIEVVLGGMSLPVTLQRETMTLWTAVGQYRGRTITVRAAGPSAAAAHWRYAARCLRT